MKRFEIFYTGGQVVAGASMREWAKAPRKGVQAVVVLHDNDAREKLHGFDYYNLKSDGSLTGSDDEKAGITKLGELIDDAGYLEIIDSLEQQSEIWNS